VEKSKRHERRWSKGLDRTMKLDEFQRFFSVIDEPKHRLCFMMQGLLGLRSSEVQVVNLRDINLEKRLIRRWNVKRKHWKTMRIPPMLYDEIVKYLEVEGEKVKLHSGYLFYSPRKIKPNQRPYLSTGHMRDLFRHYLAKAGLNDAYVEIDSAGYQPGRRRRLMRLSTHSLRHFFASQSFQKTKNIMIVKELLDHSKLSTTQIYLEEISGKANDAMDEIFPSERKESREDIEELRRVYRLYQQLKAGGSEAL